VDPLHDEDLAGPELHRNGLDRPHPLGEGVDRSLHQLAADQPEDLVVEVRQVQRVEAFEVVGSVGVLRRVHAVDVVVIHGEGDRLQSEHPELDAEPLGEGRLARGGGTGHEDEPRVRLAAADLVGDGDDLPLVEPLGDADDLRDVSADDGFVELADVAHFQLVVPGARLEVRLVELVLVLGHGPHLEVSAREAQHHPRLVGEQVEAPDRPRRRGQRPEHELPEAADRRPLHLRAARGLEQQHLVPGADCAVVLQSLLDGDAADLDRLVLADDAEHLALELLHQLLADDGDRLAVPTEGEVVAARQRLADDRAQLRIDAGGGLAEDEGGRPAVDARPVLGAVVDGVDAAVRHQRVEQGAQPAVDDGAERTEAARVRVVGEELQYGDPRHRAHAPAVQDDFDLVRRAVRRLPLPAGTGRRARIRHILSLLRAQ